MLKKEKVITFLVSIFISSHVACNVEGPLKDSPHNKHQEPPSHFVTFIMPCYNRAHIMRQAIDSIYEQNLTCPFEVICTDDGSTDDTRKILLEYQNKYPNFHFYVHEKNKGASEARNTCVAHAQGDLIFNLDTDNILAPNSVGKLVELMDHTGCEAAAFSETRFFTGKKQYRYSITYPSKDYAKHRIPVENENFCSISDTMLGYYSVVQSGNYLVTKKAYELVGGYKDYAAETLAFGFRLQATGFTFAILQNSFYWHCLSTDSKWIKDRKDGRNHPSMLATFRSFPEIFTPETNEFIANYNVKKRNIQLDLGKGNFKTIPKEALTHLFKAYRLDEENHYEDAIEHYLFAIEYGATYEKIYKRLENVQAKKDYYSSQP